MLQPAPTGARRRAALPSVASCAMNDTFPGHCRLVLKTKGEEEDEPGEGGIGDMRLVGSHDFGLFIIILAMLFLSIVCERRITWLIN